MISYREAIKQAEQELDICASSKSPEIDYVYYAYKDGECTVFALEKEAKQFSELVERVVVNQKEIDEYWERQRQLSRRASEICYNSLREEWSELSDELFGICYGESYDRGHSSGFDEISNCMYGVVNFAERILKIKEGK